jgi:hypothetical protein
MGHMNVMWYVGKFDEATWNLGALMGMTAQYLREMKADARSADEGALFPGPITALARERPRRDGIAGTQANAAARDEAMLDQRLAGPARFARYEAQRLRELAGFQRTLRDAEQAKYAFVGGSESVMHAISP